MGYASDMINPKDNDALCRNQDRLKQELKEHQNSVECKCKFCPRCSELQEFIDAASPTIS